MCIYIYVNVKRVIYLSCFFGPMVLIPTLKNNISNSYAIRFTCIISAITCRAFVEAVLYVLAIIINTFLCALFKISIEHFFMSPSRQSFYPSRCSIQKQGMYHTSK